MESNKYLYKGSFNWYGYTMKLYCYARSERQALFLFIGKVAKKVETSHRIVHYYFSDQTRDGYHIEKVAK